jgi:uncharacterized protein (DUF697 family)
MKTAEQMLAKMGYILFIILFMVSTITNVYGFILNPSTALAVWCIVWTVCMVALGCTLEEEAGL